MGWSTFFWVGCRANTTGEADQIDRLNATVEVRLGFGRPP